MTIHTISKNIIWRIGVLDIIRQLYVHSFAPIALDTHLRHGWLIHGF